MARPRKQPPKRRQYGTGSVLQRRDGSWQAQLPRGVDPKRRATYHPTRELAEEWLADQLDRFARGLDPDGGSVPLGEYVDDWLDRQAGGTGTDRAYRTRRKHLAPIDGVSLADLRPSHVEQVMAEMRKHTSRTGRPLSERYQRLVVQLLSSVLHAAIRDDLITANVTERVRLPKLPQADTIVLSEVEARQLLKASAGDRWHAVWWIMLSVGLRSGEVRGLRRDDFDAATGRLRVKRSVRTPRSIGETKGRRERWVPLSAPCVKAITAHLALLASGEGIVKRTLKRTSPKSLATSPWLFPSHVTGRPWPSNTLWHNLQRALASAGISRIRPHDLRHSAATFMIARRRPLPVVAEILGHRSAAFTASRYAHVIASQHQEVADVMGDLLTEPEGQSGAKTG